MTVYSSPSIPSAATPPPAAKPKLVVGAPDWLLAAVVIGLTVLGLIMIYSTTYVWIDGDSTYYLERQGVYAVAGLVILLVMMRVPYQSWQRVSVVMMLAILGLLVVVLIVGKAGFGATRWFLNGSLQPSEVAKLVVIIYVADWLTSKGQQIRYVALGLLPFSIIIGLVAGLILLQPNMSTAMIIAGTAFIMFYAAGADTRQMIATVAIGAVVVAGLIAQASYRAQRWITFLDPLSDPEGVGYHISRALATLNSGGLTGVGLGNTVHKYLNLLPAPHTDSIFALIGEEFGFLGSIGVILLYIVLGYRGYRVARHAPDRFGAFLAGGITILLMLQAMVNIGVITSTLPFTGVPLPFISYGGSSLVISLASVGLLLNISRYQRAETEDASTVVGRRYSGARISRASRGASPRKD